MQSSPVETQPVIKIVEVPLSTVQEIPQVSDATPLPSPGGVVSLFPAVEFNFASEQPLSPESLTVYRQQLSEAVTVESARRIADQWGVAGGVYSSPSEGMDNIIYDVMDGARSIRFLNFTDQFIYSVGYASPDYGSALMDNGPLPLLMSRWRWPPNSLSHWEF